jgi:hypothetical protein
MRRIWPRLAANLGYLRRAGATRARAAPGPDCALKGASVGGGEEHEQRGPDSPRARESGGRAAVARCDPDESADVDGVYQEESTAVSVEAGPSAPNILRVARHPLR